MNTDVTAPLNGVLDREKTEYDILIVEDNREQAELTKLLMEEYGFTARFLTNSTEAFQTISSDKPKMVILDLMMPELDGLRLCKKIKSSPEVEDTKIIIYSGRSYESDRRKALDLGADAFFTKPTRAHMLISKIRELLHPLHNESYQN